MSLKRTTWLLAVAILVMAAPAAAAQGNGDRIHVGRLDLHQSNPAGGAQSRWPTHLPLVLAGRDPARLRAVPLDPARTRIWVTAPDARIPSRWQNRSTHTSSPGRRTAPEWRSTRERPSRAFDRRPPRPPRQRRDDARLDAAPDAPPSWSPDAPSSRHDDERLRHRGCQSRTQREDAPVPGTRRKGPGSVVVA